VYKLAASAAKFSELHFASRVQLRLPATVMTRAQNFDVRKNFCSLGPVYTWRTLTGAKLNNN